MNPPGVPAILRLWHPGGDWHRAHVATGAGIMSVWWLTETVTCCHRVLVVADGGAPPFTIDEHHIPEAVHVSCPACGASYAPDLWFICHWRGDHRTSRRLVFTTAAADEDGLFHDLVETWPPAGRCGVRLPAQPILRVPAGVVDCGGCLTAP